MVTVLQSCVGLVVSAFSDRTVPSICIKPLGRLQRHHFPREPSGFIVIQHCHLSFSHHQPISHTTHPILSTMAQSSPQTLAANVASALGRTNVAEGGHLNLNVDPGSVTIINATGSTPVHIWGLIHGAHFGPGPKHAGVVNTSSGPVQIPRPEDVTTAHGTQSTNNEMRTAPRGGSSTRQKSKSNGGAADSCTRSRPSYQQRRGRQFVVSKIRRRVVHVGRKRACEDCSTKFSPMQWATRAKF